MSGAGLLIHLVVFGVYPCCSPNEQRMDVVTTTMWLFKHKALGAATFAIYCSQNREPNMSKVSHDSETPAHGQQVHSACAFIHHEFDGITKVFLPKRADTKRFLPGMYELVGGHIELYEDVRAGLVREIREELGVEISLGDVFEAFTYENKIKGSHTCEMIFFAKLVGSVVDISLNPEDHSGADWFSEEDVIARRDEIVPTQHVDHDYSDDPEYLAILKGFALLRGEPPNFG